MAKFRLKHFLFLLVVAWLPAGNAFASDGNLEVPCISLQIAQEENPQDNPGDSQSPSTNESDQEELEDDDDPPVIPHWNHLHFAVEVNLIYQLQFALYNEHQIEVDSPPPKF